MATMDYTSEENGTRMDGEQTETPDDLRVTNESVPAEKRRMYYEPQLQRADDYAGWLDERNIPEDELRALYAELTTYFGACSYWTFPLPCRGLPGLLHEDYDRDERAAKLLLLGIEYVGGAIANERKTMHNRWRSAREFIQKIEDRTEERVRTEMAEAWARQEMQRAATAPQQLVYFIGSASGPIKIGIALSPQNRLKGLQTGHHEKLDLLATCEGGQPQERSYHERFASHRLNGEWFERAPEILAEIERLTA